MWVPKILNELVVIAPHPKYMACIWVRPASKYGSFILCAYRSYKCLYNQIGENRIFNITWMRLQIYDFLSGYNLQNAFIAFMPNDTSAMYGLCALQKADPDESFFSAYKERHSLLSYHYLYPNEYNKFVFCWYRITCSLVLQYQLLSISGYLNCRRITPRFCALLHAYRALYGVAFRPSQLGFDLKKISNVIDNYFTQDCIRRLVSRINLVDNDEGCALLDVVGACGLTHIERDL